MKDIEYGQDCAFAFSHYTKIEKIFPDIVNWKIKAIKYNERVEKTKNSKIYLSILDTPKVNEFIKKQNINESEILSWIDTMYLLKRLFEHPDLDSKIKDSKIIQEYVIPYTKDNRADAIICKDNKLVIIEFTYEKAKYITKAQQCFVYKDILKQQLNNKIECYSYVFSYSNELEENYKGDCKLDEQINDLINFLNTNLTDNDAYQSLREITLKNK
jgi:hypothetical protein